MNVYCIIENGLYIKVTFSTLKAICGYISVRLSRYEATDNFLLLISFHLFQTKLLSFSYYVLLPTTLHFYDEKNKN